MEIKKETQVQEAGRPTESQLAAINAQAKAQMTAEQLYVFSLRLCDDQIDRDYERFDTAALPELARLFIGKTGVIDHKWSSENQVARIFETQVVKDGGCSYIKAWAYIRRSEKTGEIIADIEAGIKKEVSVGCSMGESICSVCGSEYGSCGHQKGEHYDGELCCAILKEPMDAYEFSFVAVPAQREAGVMKSMGRCNVRLKELAEQFGAQEEYRALYKQAELGKKYEKELQDQLVRLGLSLDLGVSEPLLRRLAEKAAPEELISLKSALEARMAQFMPMQTQLLTAPKEHEAVESGYLI